MKKEYLVRREVFPASVGSQLRSRTGTRTDKDPLGHILFIPSQTVAPLLKLIFFVVKTVTKLALNFNTLISVTNSLEG